MLEGWTFFDKVMLLVLGLSVFVTSWIFIYTHSRRKQK
jgi:hypothetical protein